ncbi:MAG TPA: DMT family transporter [Jatrophihabitans sp.]|nr:DMT family transporter [Jatrophihabitans sp.]
MRASGVGLSLAVLSAATFGTSGTFAASLMAAGWSPAAAVTVRVGVAAVILTLPALIQLRGRWPLLRRSLPAITAYGFVAVAGCQLFFFNAVEHLSVGVALLLEYSGTVLVVGWMWLRHGHRPGRLTTLGGALAIGGLVLVLDLTGAQHVDAVGVLWGLGAAAGLAVFFVLSAHTDELVPPMVMAWAGLAIGAVTLGLFELVGAVPFRASTRDVQFTGHRTSWLVPVVGLSLVAAAIAYSAGIGAARRLGARVASFVGLSEVLFAILFAWLLLDQRPGVLQLVGGVVVLLGIALVRAGEQQPDVTQPPGALHLSAPESSLI